MPLSGFAPHGLSGVVGGVEGGGGPPAPMRLSGFAPYDLSGENALSPFSLHEEAAAPSQARCAGRRSTATGAIPLSAMSDAAGLWAIALLTGFTRNPHRVFSIKMASSPSR